MRDVLEVTTKIFLNSSVPLKIQIDGHATKALESLRTDLKIKRMKSVK
jgi:hypothetical protein